MRGFLAGLALAALIVPEGAEAAVVLDGAHVTIVPNAPASVARPFARRTSAPAIYENYANLYPKGRYNASTGGALSGPHTLHGQIWLAAAFTPAQNAVIKEITIAAGYIFGMKNLVDVHLYADANGIPGQDIWSHTTSLPQFSTCCSVASLTPSGGIKLTANTQYWIGITTLPGASDTMAAWNQEVLDQLTPANLAQNRGSGWQANSAAPNFAFGVYGQ